VSLKVYTQSSFMIDFFGSLYSSKFLLFTECGAFAVQMAVLRVKFGIVYAI